MIKALKDLWLEAARLMALHRKERRVKLGPEPEVMRRCSSSEEHNPQPGDTASQVTWKGMARETPIPAQTERQGDPGQVFSQQGHRRALERKPRGCSGQGEV